MYACRRVGTTRAARSCGRRERHVLTPLRTPSALRGRSLRQVPFGGHGYCSNFCLSIFDREWKSGACRAPCAAPGRRGDFSLARTSPPQTSQPTLLLVALGPVATAWTGVVGRRRSSRCMHVRACVLDAPPRLTLDAAATACPHGPWVFGVGRLSRARGARPVCLCVNLGSPSRPVGGGGARDHAQVQGGAFGPLPYLAAQVHGQGRERGGHQGARAMNERREAGAGGG